MFLSSIEHFAQCTESDCQYRPEEDIKGFKRAVSILNTNGKILLTVPFGKEQWQPYSFNTRHYQTTVLEATTRTKNVNFFG